MDYVEKDFGKILKANALKMRRLLSGNDTNCMRVYDRNLERFPVTVDMYGPYARITDYSEEGLDEETERVCCDIVSRMLYVQAVHVVFHHRIKRMGKEQHETQSEESLMVQVSENGLLFTVDLTKRIDTGLFLDHMLTRQMVMGMSDGMTVLNLFSYTGSFSVYAAKGGARRVESVDLSGTYTAWAQKNLSDNGFPKELFPCVASDAWRYVVEAVQEGRRYDLIVFDPPCFSNSRKMDHDFDVQRDYLRWIKVLNTLLTKNGILLFSTNLSNFRMDKGAIRGYEVEDISSRVAAPGFTNRLGVARSWLLYKQQDVRLYAGDLQTVDKKAVRKQRDTEELEDTKMTKKKEVKSEEMIEDRIEDVKVAENLAEEVVQNEALVEETVENDAIDTEENDDFVEDIAEENEEEDDELDADDEESDEDFDEESDEAPVEDANTIEDDVLSLQWDDDDVGPIASVGKSEENTERKPPREFGQDRDRNSDRERGGRDDRRPSYGNRERRPYGDRDSRPSFGGDRERRPYGDRDSRPSYGGDRERRPYGDRDSRPSYGGDRERRPYGDRDSRPSYGDRERRPYGDRDSRPSFGGDRERERRPYGDRDSRPSFGGDRERRPYGDRDSRPSFGGDRERRPSYGDRDSRPSFGGDRERRPYGDRDSRPGFGGDRERRPSYGDRDSRPGFGGDRERRPSYGDRDSRPGFGGDRDRRPSYGDRDSRPGFGGERRERKSAPKPYGYDKFKNTRTRGQEENTDSFFWLEDHKDDK